MERFNRGDNDSSIRNLSNPSIFATNISVMTDFDTWKMNTQDTDLLDLNIMFNNMRDFNLDISNTRSVSSNTTSEEPYID